MNYKVEFSPDAQHDYEEAIAWYEDQKVGLGFEFTLQLSEFTAIIEKRPHHMRFLMEDTRYSKLKQFPYIIYFYIDEATLIITIFAIVHEKRNPTIWKNRLK